MCCTGDSSSGYTCLSDPNAIRRVSALWVGPQLSIITASKEGAIARRRRAWSSRSPWRLRRRNRGNEAIHHCHAVAIRSRWGSPLPLPSVASTADVIGHFGTVAVSYAAGP